MEKGPSLNDVGNRKGEGLNIGPVDSTKKLTTWGRGVCQKSGKIVDVVYGMMVHV
jgi:hypothetical protein